VNELEFLTEIAKLLAPYLPRLVVVGGFAVELFHLHPALRSAAAGVLTTRDLDLAAPDDLSIAGGKSLGRLLGEAGFREQLKGNAPVPFSELSPPVAWGAGYGVEILIPRYGPKGNEVTRFHDLGAACLRYVDLLLADPWVLTKAVCPALPADMAVRVVHPAAYLAQKLLTLEDRADPHKQRKDRAYCFSVVARAVDRRALGQETCARVRRRGFPKGAAKLRKKAAREFGEIFSVGTRDASLYLGLPAQPLLPRRVYDVMRPFVVGIGDDR